MEQDWFNKYAVYQIYPMSFCDSNGDGKGDIPGIISKLDYLQSIGIHTIWLSPIYASPMVDMGYDISDYYKINPIFGTMDDFDNLIQEARKREIRIIMDLVVNHTSDQCAWFQEALKNPKSKYRDYYIFKKGKGHRHRTVPNNWKSSFLGSAWEELKNEKGTFYLHLFSKEQPDLNWRNPEVLKEVEKIMNFWMDKGVYGFRCDVISCIYKDSFRDGKKQKLTSGMPVGMERYVATDGCHKILKKLREDVIIPHHGVLIGETFGVTLKTGPKFLDGELDTFFSFAHTAINAGKWSKEYIDPIVFKKTLMEWQKDIKWNGVYLENHDQHRAINKYVKKGYEEIGAKMLLTLVYTLRGTPFIYQGQEIGMRDYPSLKIDQCNDLVTHFIFDLAHKHYHLPKWIAMKKAKHNGRDDARAPMAFSDKDGFGFTDPGVQPWQIFSPFSTTINVKTEEEDENSVLNYFKKITALREKSSALSIGAIHYMKDTPENVLAFIRESPEEKLLVVLNLNNRVERIDKLISHFEIEKNLLCNNNNPSNYRAMLPYESDVFKIKEK